MPRGGARNRKPTKLKLIAGTYRPDRVVNEPKPRPIAPPVPEGMDPLARATWKRLAPILERFGLLTEIDGPMFEMLCEAWSRWQYAKRQLAEVRKRTRSRKTLRIAEVSVEQAEKSFRLLCNEFGLTPAARSRLNLPTLDEAEEDEFEEFLRSGKQARMPSRPPLEAKKHEN